MPVYIGIGFYTSSDFLYKRTESLGLPKHSALINLNKIAEDLKVQFSLNSLYIATNFDDEPNVVFFEKIINTAYPYCTVTQPIDTTTSREFQHFRDFAEPDHNIDLIVYCANGILELGQSSLREDG